ncbi:GmrSD restriction endonuclease domain-containing protein [Micrococcus lylae]|uniref:GmrSD restriction endonuclease domain-containing protein n=1 Tax=Micrococcus lylae TaxID=1273 RepID=UPI003EBF844B
MPETFGHHPWTVQDLVDGVDSGRVRLPDIQRPFVWGNAKVRDLVDSMYRGFPVGQVMFWENRADEHTKSIGVADKTQAGSMQVVDGQQRLTSLYAVVKGAKVLRDDYAEERIVVAFNPKTERFAVPDNAIRRSAEWIHDIRTVFEQPITARRDYIEALETAQGGERLSRDEETAIEVAINRLADVLKYQFYVVQLKESVGRETVADIFVRINSQGVKLSSGDFILTWLSVFWEQGRQELEDFARHSRFTPQEMSRMLDRPVRWTPKNPYLTLDAVHMLRVAMAVGNGRAQFADAYNALRGRDPRTREIVPENRERELEKLKEGHRVALDPKNWDEYLKVLERAGVRTSSMITSKNAVIYGYALWLIGRTRFGVSVDALREGMARWFFMVQITGRFSGSPESKAQEDLNRLNALTERTPEAFLEAIDAQIARTLTADWWSLSFPEDLHTSNIFGPAYLGYVAALTILDADTLLSTLKVKDWLDPSRRPVKGMEKHHLFPKDHLKQDLGITSYSHINQVANQALVEWSDNIEISNAKPSEYWDKQVRDKAIEGDRLAQQMWWHALPEDWTELPYDDFLKERRRLIAEVTYEGFRKLSDPNYQPRTASWPVADTTPVLPAFDELVRDGALAAGMELVPASGQTESIVEITEDGTLRLGDEEHKTPDLAAQADGAEDVDGWEYWMVKDEGRLLAEVRQGANA